MGRRQGDLDPVDDQHSRTSGSTSTANCGYVPACDHVVDHHGHDGAVLVVDETADGTRSRNRTDRAPSLVGVNVVRPGGRCTLTLNGQPDIRF